MPVFGRLVRRRQHFTSRRQIAAGAANPASEATGFQGVFKSTGGGMTRLAMNQGLDALIGTRLTTANRSSSTATIAAFSISGLPMPECFAAATAPPTGVRSMTAWLTCRFAPWQ